jgi:A/G-specific adenine glycosylase
MKPNKNHQFFVDGLLKWNVSDNKRVMPWKGEKDPYKIWLSEIILQQTRVEQGLDYYNSFVNQFPSVHDLAKAPDNVVFKLWEGLGYYTRCKNLITTARHISTERSGNFPNTYEEILALKGIGPYTAAAIGSFAFNLPAAVVDGNVFRVLSRYFGISHSIDSVEGKRIFTQLASELLDKKAPGIYNQSLMDFGAVICKPKSPNCKQCTFQKKCDAFMNNRVGSLPVKKKPIVKRTRWFYYFVVEHRGSFYVRKRSTKDVWENLYEFMLLETSSQSSIEELMEVKQVKEIMKRDNAELEHISHIYKQQLTHQTICGRFFKIKLTKKITLPGFELIKKNELDNHPFPKLITTYLKDKTVSLNLF